MKKRYGADEKLKKRKQIIFFSILLTLMVSVSDSSITITSSELNYNTKESGSWSLTSSASWTGTNTLTLNINVKSTSKTNYDYSDTVLVIDNSESMEYENWTNIKNACDNLIEDVYSNTKNRMGIIT